MKAILAAVALFSVTVTPVFADELGDIMSGQSLKLSTVEMQRTVGAGVSTSIATSFNQAENTAMFGSIFNSQFSTANATAAAPFFGSSFSQAASGNAVRNLTFGGLITNFQESNSNAFSF